MTPDRDALVARRPSPAASDAVPAPAVSATSTVPAADLAADLVAAVRLVPAPRPEVLARVLERLRELPTDTVDDRARRASDDEGPGASLPLPRRRS